MKIAVILPRGMNFGENGATSIDLVAHDLWQWSRFKTQTYFLSEPVENPFCDTDFRPVSGQTQRELSAGYIRALRADPPDLIIVHQHPETAATIARQMPAIPVILHRHGMLKEKRSFLSTWNKARQFRRLAGIVFVSDFIRHRFLKQFPAMESICHVAHNGIDTSLWQPGDKHLELAFVGRAREDKGLLPLLNAFLNLQTMGAAEGWRLRLVLAVLTAAEREFATRLQSLCQGSPTIEFIENQTADEVRQTLARASIAVLPSLVLEGFGKAMVESLACGCATITTTQGGIPEAVGAGAICLNVDPQETFQERLATEMARLMSDPSARQTLAEQGRQHVNDNFLLSSRAAAYDTMLESIQSDFTAKT